MLVPIFNESEHKFIVVGKAQISMNDVTAQPKILVNYGFLYQRYAAVFVPGAVFPKPQVGKYFFRNGKDACI